MDALLLLIASVLAGPLDLDPPKPAPGAIRTTLTELRPGDPFPDLAIATDDGPTSLSRFEGDRAVLFWSKAEPRSRRWLRHWRDEAAHDAGRTYIAIQLDPAIRPSRRSAQGLIEAAPRGDTFDVVTADVEDPSRSIRMVPLGYLIGEDGILELVVWEGRAHRLVPP